MQNKIPLSSLEIQKDGSFKVNGMSYEKIGNPTIGIDSTNSSNCSNLQCDGSYNNNGCTNTNTCDSTNFLVCHQPRRGLPK